MKQIPNESLGMAGMSQGTFDKSTSTLSSWSMLSYLGRVNYNYKSKYYATASFRADGSSKFSKRIVMATSLQAHWRGASPKKTS